MESKTISYLNGKAWYRLLKVVYVFVFLFVSAGAILIVSDLNGARRVNDYRVVCNYGSRASFLAQKDKGIYLDDVSTNGLGYLPDSQRVSLQAACGITEAEVKSLPNPFNPAQRAEAEAAPPLETITKENVTTGGIGEVVGYSLLAVLVIALVFEIARRAFYYIALGSLRPVK